jgi:hypothetical protein
MSSSPSKISRNDKGGILIKEEELKVAWDFFDTKVQEFLASIYFVDARTEGI